MGSCPETGRTGEAGESDELEPCRRLVELSAGFSAAFQRWLDSSTSDGLNFPRLRLLERLHCQGPQMMRALADDLCLTPRNVTALVDALESDGLVRRVPHESDRRVTMVESTPAGVAAADETLGPKLDAIGALFDDLSAEDRDRFADILVQLLGALRERGERA